MKVITRSSRLKQSLIIALRLLFGCICCVGFLLFVLLSVPIYIFRLIVIIGAKYFRPDLGEILNPVSSILVNDLFSGKPSRAGIVISVTIQGHVSIQEAQETILRNWINATDKNTGKPVYQKFQQYPCRWLGFTFWKTNPDFNLEDHLHFHPNLDIAKPVVTDPELTEFTQKILNETFPARKGLWSLHLFQNYHNPKLVEGEMTVAILKLHHSLADGYSILSALVEGLLEFPLSNVKMPEPHYPKRSFWEKMMYWVTFPFTSFYELSYVFSNNFRKCPWKIPDEKKAWNQLVGKSELIPIQTIKDIKNSFGVSFTSVILSAISAAIWEHLESKKASGNRFDNDGSMFCLTPLPIPGHSRMLTNHMTIALFDLPTNEFGSSLERLIACDSMLENTKNTIIPRLALIFLYTVGWHLNSIISVFTKTTNSVSTGLTCFPSLPINIERENRKGVAADFVVGALEGNAGAAFGVLSFDKNIMFTVTAEEAVMCKEEVNNFIVSVTAEINRLHAKISQEV